jgi:biopolymer transport protein ExbB
MTTDDFLGCLAGIQDSLSAGGPVMIPLVAVSVVMWTLIIQRALFFARLYHRNMPRTQAADCIRENRLPDFTRFRGAMALLVGTFQQRRIGRPTVDRQILDETVMSLVASLDAHLALIGVLASVAPLLGLLGTVTGMISTFDIIAVYGTGNAKAMAGGISEALITTQAGLLVAIPGLYMRNFLSRRAERLKQRIAAAGMYLRRFV